MAIRLASAIGQQREPIGILGGLDDAINKTGDAIQAANQRKAAEEAKKRDAALQAAINIDTDINALPEDNKRYNQAAKKMIGEALMLSANGASPSQLLEKKREIENTLAPMKNRYEKDFVDFQNIEKFAKESENKRDLSEATTFLTGASKAEVPMPSQAPTDRAMPLNKEDSDVTEVVDVQQTPYWELDWKEREKVAPGGVYTEVIKRSKDITGNFNDAIDGYTGGKFDPQGRFTNLQDVLKAGGLDKQQVVIDNEGIAKEKSSFISSFGSGLGDVKTKQYWNTLTNLAAKRGREAGLTGDRLKSFVEQNVKTVAAQDFDNFVNQEIAKTKIKKIDQDPDTERKGIVMNFNGNGSGGGSNKYWNVQKGETRDLNKAKDGVPTKEKLGKYIEYTFESIATPENAKVINLGGYNNVAMKAAEVNNETGDVEYIRVVVPEMAASRENGFKAQKGGTRMVKVTKDDVNSLRTNLGEELYDKTIGSLKTTKVETKKETPKSAAPKSALDKIKAKSKKPIAEYQVNKAGTKAKVKFSDGTEQVIDL